MNSLSIVGNLTKDPELRYTPSGKPVCQLRVAVSGIGDATPLYLDIATFGPQAEACSKHLSRGRKIGFTGRLAYREWTASDGTLHSRHSGIGRVEFLDRPAADAGNVPGDEDDASFEAVTASVAGEGQPA